MITDKATYWALCWTVGGASRLMKATALVITLRIPSGTFGLCAKPSTATRNSPNALRVYGLRLEL